jgi:hypothetical protein
MKLEISAKADTAHGKKIPAWLFENKYYRDRDLYN